MRCVFCLRNMDDDKSFNNCQSSKSICIPEDYGMKTTNNRCSKTDKRFGDLE